MYYFIKKIHSINNQEEASKPIPPSQDFSNYTEVFNFLKFVYTDKIGLLSDIVKKDASFIPDIAASVLKGLAINNYLSNELLLKALHCCRDILSHMMYEETHIDTIRQTVANDQDRIIVIPGCQTEVILTNRAEHAAEIFKKLHIPAKFVPVGKNPDRESVRILNESSRIKTILEQKLGSDLEIIPLELEEESLRTIHNVENLFSNNFIDKHRSTSVFLVSL